MSKFYDLTTEYSYMFDRQYRISTGGVQQGKVETSVTDDGREVKRFVPDKLVSRKPILPTAIMDNLDSAVQKVEIALWDQGRWKRIVSNREKLTNSSKIITLADQGVPVGTDNARFMAQYFNSVLADFDERLPRHPARSVMGWTENDGRELFMPYSDSIKFDGDDTYRYLYNAIKQKGKLSDWVSYTEPLRLSIEIRLIMAAAFASPLIELIGENPFVMHLWGGTGTAKTVSLLIAASIFGNPAMGKLVRTMNMTPNAMMSTAAFLNSIPFCGDELQTIKNNFDSYDRLIMQITEGVDRGRMRYNQMEDTKSWRCSFLFTGEEPCVKNGSGGGVVNRVIQIEVKDKLVDNGNAVANFYKTHYGTAGPEYIGALQSGLFEPVELYQQFFSELIKHDTTDKQAGAMALMLAADRIAHDVFFHNEPDLEVQDVIEYLASQKQVDVTERAYQFVCGVLAENSGNFDPEYSKVLWGKSEPAESAVYVNKTVLNRIMTAAGYDFEACKKAWVRNGHIMKDAYGKHTHYMSINGMPTRYVKLIMPRQEQITLTDYNGTTPFTEGA